MEGVQLFWSSIFFVVSEVRGTTLQMLIVDSKARGTTLQKLSSIARYEARLYKSEFRSESEKTDKSEK